jgi:phosphopantothenoylcysteine decarboxylase/phosphopantothenate--cysteine ligase
MAKIVAGIADDMLTCVVLATRAPVIIAPAMHADMYLNPVTQENIEKLRARGITIVDPAYGRLASGGIGPGRLAEVEKIIGTIRQVLGRDGDLAEKHIVITAGGTREAIDPVRFVGNRSSGKMGYAMVEAARDRGAKVTLISTASLTEPVGVEVIYVESAAQMKEAVTAATAKADALIMAAAVADYQPKRIAEEKIKKEASGPGLTLELVKTPDILAEVRGDFIRVGFAAESEGLIANARQKLERKQLDLIAANDITATGSGFGVDTNKVVLIGRRGIVEDLPLMTKREVADRILDRVVEFLAGKGEK